MDFVSWVGKEGVKEEVSKETVRQAEVVAAGGSTLKMSSLVVCS